MPKSIRNKILLCVSIALLGYVLSMIYTTMSNLDNNKRLSLLKNEYFPLTILGTEIQSHFSQIRKSYEDGFILGDEDAVMKGKDFGDRVQMNLADITVKLAALKNELLEEKAAYIVKEFTAFHREAPDVFVKLANGEESAELQQKAIGFAQTTEALSVKIQEFQNDLIYSTNTAIDRQQSISYRNMFIQLIVFVIIVIVALIFSMQMTQRWIVNPVNEIVDRIKDIAGGGGDLTKRIDIEADGELAELTNGMNTFIETIHQIVARISNVTDDLTSSSSELSVISGGLISEAKQLKVDTDQVAQGSQVITLSVSDIASQTGETSTFVRDTTTMTQDLGQEFNTIATLASDISHEMGAVVQSIDAATQDVDSITSNINEITDSVEISARAIEDLNSSLNEVSVNTQNANQISSDAASQAEETAKVIQNLQHASDQIGKIINIINDIADQTNMLALNATIEAASAGDAGKGFTVVANEVKELAKQTAQAVDKIGNEIETMQLTTKNAVGSVEEIATTIFKINSINHSIAAAVEEQSATTSNLASSIAMAAENSNIVRDSVNNVNTKIQDVDSKTKIVGKDVQTIAKNSISAATVFEQIVKASSEANNKTNQIADNTHNIQDNMMNIQARIMKLSQIADDTNKQAVGSNELAVTLSEISEILKSLVDQFKI